MDNLASIYRIDQLETIELINLTAKFNTHTLIEVEKDRLDQLILANDFNMRMFEILTDENVKESLQNIVNSLQTKQHLYFRFNYQRD